LPRPVEYGAAPGNAAALPRVYRFEMTWFAPHPVLSTSARNRRGPFASPLGQTRAGGYTFAVAISLISIAITGVVFVLIGSLYLPIPLGAGFLVGLVAGFGPAAVASIVQALGVAFLFLEPVMSLRVSAPEDQVRLLLFALLAPALGWAASVVRRSAHDARANEQRLRALFEQAATAIAELDLDGRWIRVNERVCALLGYTAEELRTRTSASLTHPADRERDATIFARLARGDLDGDVVEKRYVAKDGRVVWATVARSLIRDSVGRPRSFVAVLVDATERKAVEAERDRSLEDARAALRARDEFLSIASHELRTPLTALRLQLQAVLRERASGDGADGVGRRLEVSERQVTRLAALIDEIMAVQRIAAGQLVIEARPTHVAALVDGAARDAASELARAGVSLDVEVDGSLRALADPLHARAVLSKLLSNAAKYGLGKPIEVRAWRAGDRVVVGVRDHGIGIAPDDQARIFERFERVVSAHNVGGLGLGLWVARQVVLAHGGGIAVESAPGRGSTFTVELPGA
jgi:PAS domain S-box-containing protein